MNWQKRLFSFQGRSTRLDYWLTHLGLVLGVIFLAGIFGFDSGATGSSNVRILIVIVGGIGFLFCLWPIWSVGVKRCHDRDKSGWWLVGWTIGGLIPYLGVLVSLWALVELGFLDGTQGPNEYGPSPKGVGNTQVADVFS